MKKVELNREPELHDVVTMIEYDAYNVHVHLTNPAELYKRHRIFKGDARFEELGCRAHFKEGFHQLGKVVRIRLRGRDV